ncbi:AB hydrolase superfamily protein [Fulvia fulva]|uniref:AB hydrolase superfamily protein n=1 Tax=Passalora fulva TaxID=5499 RepID=A0A9Q8LBM6_PASFU|nr:AB hydrolase superfamily protein [Fulvia fulva]KAK4632045.1 AB hydrolase superfamily protein [Fulvia fulva]KAK4633331.1 AB hydrolase superfamily protein [Fulvia fulva]UJO14452.1 AB hydrolase superfamily protein [Fulvia fulva]WPV11001.1 AB hydrolase superfamily protein [Fulvia fulva]WPV25803.1 AB hydrolase superfamily protein [Fulvia fulva]
MLLTREELDKSSHPDPQVAEYYAKNPAQAHENDPLVVRAGMAAYTEAVLSKLGGSPTGQTVFYHDIPMRDDFSSTLKIFKPTDDRPPGALIVLCFGGGFIAGSKDQLTEIARTLVHLFGATVVNISYRLAPEWKFPYAQLDAWDSMKWIAENATGELLSADPRNGFLLGGVSAGGAITACLSRKFQEEPLKWPLTGQWLCVPSLMHKDICPEKYRELFISHDQNASAPGLTRESREMMREAAQWDASSDLRYAVNSATPLSGQPRAFFQVDGMDPLRDDALIYDEMLKEAGVETKFDFYLGCPHAHWFTMRGMEIGDRARVDCVEGFGWLLREEIKRERIVEVLGIKTWW